MINLKNHRFLLLGIFIILPILYGLLSCSTTKSSTSKTDLIQYYYHPKYLAELEIQKKTLNQESVEIVRNLNNRLELNKPQNATAINSLFQNLEDQFQIDNIYEEIYLHAATDSLKLYGLKNLMESADFYYHVFHQSKHIRRIINRGDKAHNIPKYALEKPLKYISNSRNREIAHQFHRDFKIANRYSGNLRMEQKVDHLEELTYEVAGFCSQAFSKLISKINFQKESDSKRNLLLPHLKKWDIICQKSPGRATDLFIPGYFGHSGIYLGNNVFVECNQNGVYYNSATKFLEGSDFIVIRNELITNKQEKTMTRIVQAQLGKEYDYNFNIESPDRLTCTELIYLVYDNINWTNRNIISWKSISPDDLVSTAIENENLNIPLFINKDVIIENPEREIIEDLLAQN